MPTFDLDCVEIWGPALTHELLRSEASAVGERLRAVGLGDGEARFEEALFSILPERDFVRSVERWIAKHTVAAYHGSRLDESELQSIKRDGLKILSTTDRRETLVKKFDKHPSWPSVSPKLNDVLARLGPGHAAGVRNGRVYATMSRTHLLECHDVVQEGSEFDRHAAYRLFGKGASLLPPHGRSTVVVIGVPGEIALNAANRPPADPGLPHLIRELAHVWSSWLAAPEHLVSTTCDLEFDRDVPADWITEISHPTGL